MNKLALLPIAALLTQPLTTRPVRYQRRTCLAVAATLAIAGLVGLVGLPTQVLALPNRNETGLPLYPGATTGSQYPPMQIKGRWYAIYTAQSRDSLAVVEAWYRHALPQAKETKDEDQLTHGIVLTNGNDKVLVYQLGKLAATVIELQKYVRG